MPLSSRKGQSVLDSIDVYLSQVVVEGCCHGESDKVIGQLKEREEMAVDLLIMI